MINEIQLHEGMIIIQDVDKHGTIVKEEVIYNRVMNDWLNEVITMLVGTSSNDYEMGYLAFGTSATSITDADTQLSAEVFRTPVVAINKIDVGRVQSTFFLADTEALFNIKEIGFFCGSAATGAANTGRMLSRILWNRDRTSGAAAINFTRIDTIGRK